MKRMRRMIVLLALLALLVPVATAATPSNVVVDGNPNSPPPAPDPEWPADSFMADDLRDTESPQADKYDIQYVYSTTNDSGDFFIRFDTYANVVVNQSAFTEIWFDVDNNPGTGHYDEVAHGTVGAEYRVRWYMDTDAPFNDACTLYEWSGTWTQVGSGDTYCNGEHAADSKAVEVFVSGQHLGLPRPEMGIHLYFDNGATPSDDHVQWVFEQSGGEGCTPGYWKQPQHVNYWVNPPYDPNLYFDEVFEVVLGPHVTLLEAVSLKGGGENALARHAVAALLNAAANSGVSYKYSVDQVIAMVQDAYATPDFETNKNLFVDENELGCPLD